MRQLLPSDDDVEVATVYAADRRPSSPEHPWLMVNMIASVDGGTAVQGRSGALGGPADKAVFDAVRAVADVILVGASTVRAEAYGAPRPSAERQAERLARGQVARPRLAIVSRSLALEPSSELFGDPTPPLVITTTDADPRRRASLAEVAEVVEAGTGSVDLGEALRALGRRAAEVVLAEGGPTLNGQLVAAGLVDEICLSVSPNLIAGPSRRVTQGVEDLEPLGLTLDRVLTADSFLFLRYARTIQT
jgi:riboflavin-specific deaminase-like protein